MRGQAHGPPMGHVLCGDCGAGPRPVQSSNVAATDLSLEIPSALIAGAIGCVGAARQWGRGLVSGVRSHDSGGAEVAVSVVGLDVVMGTAHGSSAAVMRLRSGPEGCGIAGVWQKCYPSLRRWAALVSLPPGAYAGVVRWGAGSTVNS